MYFPQFGSQYAMTNYKASGPVNVQKTGGQFSIGDTLGGIAGDIAGGIREYTRLRIEQELNNAMPGRTYDPLNAPYGYDPRRDTGPANMPQGGGGDATGALVLAALGGAALAFL